MADKRKPTYDLDAFKASFASVEKLTMQRGHFYKSMTAYIDSRLWQDVYHVPSPVGMLYVKFTADTITEFLLLSFKEKDND